MQRTLHWLLTAAMLGAGAAPQVSAQPSGRESAVTLVTYVEALPSATSQAVELLTAYAEAGHRADGNLEFRALQRIGRPNHFVFLEAWADASALERHAGSPDAERFAAQLAPLLYSPPDRRIHSRLLTGPRREIGAGAVYVLTHVDVIPTGVGPVVDSLRTLADASRAEAGNLRFDVLVTARRNHMTVIEVWQNADAQVAHLSAPHSRDFRAGLAGALGALYDERLYREL